MLRAFSRLAFIAACSGLLLAGAQRASAQETFAIGTVQPGVGAANTTNIRGAGDPTFAATGGYTLRYIRYTGTITEINSTTADWTRENRLHLWDPTRSVGMTATATVQPPGFDYLGPIAISGIAVLASPFDPVGTWAYRFYNSTDDTPAGLADSEITGVNIEFLNSISAPGATNIGSIVNTTDDYLTPDLTVNYSGAGVLWFQFTLPQAIGGSSWLDIDTGNNGGGDWDTEIAVYDVTGRMVATDDDDGPSTFSALSFGQTSPTRGPVPGALAGNGRDGNLAAGTYYLAAALWDMDPAHGFLVTTDDPTPANFAINFRTNVPEPGTLAALGLGALALLRRRMKK